MHIKAPASTVRPRRALKSRAGLLRNSFLTAGLALGLMFTGQTGVANAATVTLTGFGYTVTVCCSTVVANAGGLNCQDACTNINNFPGVSCVYNPSNGTVTISRDILAYVERSLVTEGGVIDVAPGGGALMTFEPEQGSMTLASPHPGVEIVVITGDGEQHTPGKDGRVTFPLDYGAQASIVNHRPVPPNGKANDETKADRVSFSDGNATCGALSGGEKEPSAPSKTEVKAPTKL